MKSIFYFILLLLFFVIFFCAKCKREPCHENISITNNSADTVVISELVYSTTNTCRLDGKILSPNAAIWWSANSRCWEETPFDFFVLNAATYDNSEFTNCDSLAVDYDILVHWTLTHDELEARNFELTYP